MTGPLLTVGLSLMCLWLAVGPASAAGPSPGDLKKLGLVRIDPPIKAPEIRLKDLEQRQMSLEDLRGKGVLIYFWASW